MPPERLDVEAGAEDLFGVEVGAPIPVLTAGNMGAVRSKLVAGRNVHLIPAEDALSAIDVATIGHVRVCLLRYDLPGGTAIDVLDALRDARPADKPPCIVLLSVAEWEHADECIAAGAEDVVELGDTEQAIFAVAKALGLNFGRGPRAALETRAAIEIDGQWLELDTVDLRPSGIAVREMPPVEVGTRVRLKVDLLDNLVEVWALVARRWERDGVQMAGLQFLGLTRLQRNWLKAAVAALRTPEADDDPAAAAIPPPAPQAERASAGPGPAGRAEELAAAQDDADDPVVRSRWHLEQALLGEGDRDEHPHWIYGLIPELTPIERSGVLGVKVPDWVHQAIRIRLMLARFRDDCPVGPPPKPITEACQQLFDALARESGDGADFDMAEQIGLIKGRIIQEFLEGPDEHAATREPPRYVAPPVLKKPAPFGPASKRPPDKARPTPRPRGPAEDSLPAASPDALGTAARRALIPLMCTLSIAIIVAIGARIFTRDTPDRTVTRIGAADLATPFLASMDVTTDLASAVVTPAWFAKTREDQIVSLGKVRPRLNAWQLPVRFVVLRNTTGEPIALFDFDRKELLSLDQPVHLVVTRWRK